MPQVRTYGARRVGLEALPDVRRTAAETSLSTGVGVEEAKQQKAAAIGQLGQGLTRAGSQFAAIALEEKQKADEAAILEAENALGKWENQRMYDPEAGALTVRGKDAQPLPETVGGEFEKKADEVANTLKTPEQRAVFAKLRAKHGLDIDLQLRRHVYGEMRTFYADELKGVVANSTNAAIANASDPRRVGDELSKVAIAISQGAKRLGMGPEEAQAAIDAARTQIHAGVVHRLIAEGKDRQASAYFQGVKNQIVTGEARAQLEAQLDTASTQGEGLRTAETLWQQLGPKGEQDPINLDKMETAAREKYADDPKALQATISFLRERKAGVDSGRKEREEATSGAVWIAASKGASLAQITRMPEFLALPGRAQASVSDYIVNRGERQEARALAAEQRAYTAGQRQQSVKEQKGWARYWELSSPTTLDATSENALQGMRGELGDDHVNRLLTQKRSLTKSEETVRDATIDDDLFKVTAAASGLDAYSPKTDGEKAELGQLKNSVETAIDAEQRRLGKVLTREQKQAIMHNLTDQKVMLNRWGFDPEKIAAMVTNPSDRAAAYVPIAKVPPAALTQYLNYARSLSPGLAKTSDAEISARFGDRIQRAYALRVLGGSRAEIEAAMKGEE